MDAYTATTAELDRLEREYNAMHYRICEARERRDAAAAAVVAAAVPTSAQLYARLIAHKHRETAKQEADNAADQARAVEETPRVLALLNDPHGWRLEKLDGRGRMDADVFVKNIRAQDISCYTSMAVDRVGLFHFFGNDDYYVFRDDPSPLVAQIEATHQAETAQRVADMPAYLDAFVWYLVCSLPLDDGDLTSWFYTHHPLRFAPPKGAWFPRHLWDDNVRNGLCARLRKFFAPEHFKVVMTEDHPSVRITRINTSEQ